MLNDLIQQAARLMEEQATAYARLESACGQLSSALVRSEPALIESLTRAGEGELLRMRSRLVQIMSLLTSFADARAASPDGGPLTSETRSAFESASQKLTQAARDFKRVQEKALVLATSGSTFSTACIEMCGIKPTTYSAPYARRGEGPRWR